MSLIEMRVPPVGESINEVTLSRWLKEEGAIVKLDEPICEFESDKATLEFPAEATGKLTYVAKEGDDLTIGALVATIDTSFVSEAATVPTAPKETSAPTVLVEKAAPAAANTYAAGHPSPAASKILEEKGIPANSIQGSGKDGRITKADAAQAVPAKQQDQPSVVKGSAPAHFSRTEERKKMSRMRRTIAKRLVSAKNETAMLTTFNEVDLTAIMQIRDKYQEKFVAKYGIKLGFMSIFAKACAKVLMEMPEINARIDGEELVLPNYADISFAISTPNGLVVPPIKNIESLSFADIELALKNLAQKARNGSLTLDEMSGGTFTITNGGVFGSLLSTPIINEPQSAILGMHSIKNRPVAIDGKVEIRPMMYLAMSYDHRVIDGSSSVTFLVKVKDLLEDPILLFMDL
ncbi:MAG: 2-oxoglutarate dehydrogenase complex dihydrolipoyllysine-residue succinyltransferase [Saprospiraceae bacterium]|jgi:2-oxoglutarate dehydrogenase E2 component (dihydrolipoamide succinyltransferase)|nr:2-oxoglutarate dehydrogenase complex dihydrolipoyllysine-residue succinyltransferase [Saprospiraceae bacterium]MCF8301190.1 2-oxoglutarate dehydrogenase complex dihydrolipoyllysine-residue succinyltransferase [Haliscomenobacter sp.]